MRNGRQTSRRRFLKNASGVLGGLAVAGRARGAHAEHLKLPLGLELYSVREQLPADYSGTLHQIADLGYRDVEAAGFFGHSADQVNAMMKSAGLHLISAHFGFNQLYPDPGATIDLAKALGLQYIICPGPGRKDPSSHGPITLEDWRWNAEQFNKIGAAVNAAGMRFGYHNHRMEFQKLDGAIPYNELLRLTDPAKVTMEMDCGWVIVGGANPVEYMRRYPHRFLLIHVKDFKLPANRPADTASEKIPQITELGRGSIDYRPILREAVKIGVRHYFVEQEAFDVAPMESLKIDADYMRNLEI
jgi:sugar phosphate isomerase/epimerase